MAHSPKPTSNRICTEQSVCNVWSCDTVISAVPHCFPAMIHVPLLSYQRGIRGAKKDHFHETAAETLSTCLVSEQLFCSVSSRITDGFFSDLDYLDLRCAKGHTSVGT